MLSAGGPVLYPAEVMKPVKERHCGAIEKGRGADGMRV
jgi:hypothetical protein